MAPDQQQRHHTVAEHDVTNGLLRTTFWRRAAHSFPAEVRKRHAVDLERAEELDLFISRLIDAWRGIRTALGRRRRKALSGR